MKCKDCGVPIAVGSCCASCYYEFHESRQELGDGEMEIEERDEEGE